MEEGFQIEEVLKGQDGYTASVLNPRKNSGSVFPQLQENIVDPTRPSPTHPAHVDMPLIMQTVNFTYEKSAGFCGSIQLNISITQKMELTLLCQPVTIFSGVLARAWQY